MTAEAKNIPTTGAPTGATGVQDAVRGENRAPSGKPATNKGEVFTSFDVNAFEVPSGRDEIWRFTPLRRLRGLHEQLGVRLRDQCLRAVLARDCLGLLRSHGLDLPASVYAVSQQARGSDLKGRHALHE
jgi:hypothetical protein